MLPFPVSLVPGRPVYEQIVHAMKKALLTGKLKEGDRLPSIRAISQELNVNPNTVQKAFAELTSQGFLEVYTGRGCFVSKIPATQDLEAARILHPQIEDLLIEARRLGVSDRKLIQFIQEQSKEIRQS